MENNYRILDIEYHKESILDILPTEIGYGACNIDGIRKIQSILNIVIPIQSILYFNLKPNTIGLIHKDINYSNAKENTPIALNLPLSNCNETFMYWFREIEKGRSPLFFEGPTNKSVTPQLEQDNALQIDTVNCNVPLLVRIDDWHSINNLGADTCRIISVRFNKIFNEEFILQRIAK